MAAGIGGFPGPVLRYFDSVFDEFAGVIEGRAEDLFDAPNLARVEHEAAQVFFALRQTRQVRKPGTVDVADTTARRDLSPKKFRQPVIVDDAAAGRKWVAGLPVA